jgi:hypothetical protein
MDREAEYYIFYQPLLTVDLPSSRTNSFAKLGSCTRRRVLHESQLLVLPITGGESTPPRYAANLRRGGAATDSARRGDRRSLDSARSGPRSR